jgi:flavin-dependent dehydrogenase
MRVPASLTIVAEGRGARLARALGLAAVPARPRRWAVGAYVDDVADLTTCGEMHVRRGHYLGIAPLPGGAANICLVTDERAGLARPLARLLAAFRGDPMLRDRFARARPVAPAVSVGPLALDEKATGCPGLLLAGDAAGFIDPMTGDGLRFAIAGAAFAARAALEALDTGTTGSASAVDRWRRRAFASKWRFNRSLRWLVAHALPLRVAAAAAAICPSLIRATIAVAGDCPRDTEEVELGWQTLG